MPAPVTVYEKPSCTTCRKLAALLEAHGIAYEAVDYHVRGLTEPEVRTIVAATGRPARELLRARDPRFRELGLGEREADDEEVIARIVEHPPLMERPVVVVGERAVLARPIERALELVDGGAGTS